MLYESSAGSIDCFLKPGTYIILKCNIVTEWHHWIYQNTWSFSFSSKRFYTSLVCKSGSYPLIIYPSEPKQPLLPNIFLYCVSSFPYDKVNKWLHVLHNTSNKWNIIAITAQYIFIEHRNHVYRKNIHSLNWVGNTGSPHEMTAGEGASRWLHLNSTYLAPCYISCMTSKIVFLTQ